MGQTALRGLAKSTNGPRSNRTIAAQNGVALVTTLIMLSLVTFMSVAFLALSRRERAAVSVAAEQVQAKMMADMALARAQVDIVTPMLAATNRWDYDLLVSTNYIRAGGYSSGLYTNLLNVSYEDGLGNPLSAADQTTNILNLFYDPRPPVYIDTNIIGSNSPLDFRYYVDFNRNGLFELTDRGNSTNPLVGDPQWIGVLEKPGFDDNGNPYRHSGNNRFTGRYAYLVLPAGKSLDLNYLYNQAKYLGTNSEGFLRNQGFANYELNLAAFLRDLNTNIWDYNYSTNLGGASTGIGFFDALQLARYRYKGDYFNLSNVATLYGNAGGDIAFQTDMIDGLGDGPLMTGFRLLSADNDTNNIFNGWFGSPVPQPFFDVQQLFDTKQVFAGFATRLRSLWLNTNYYNRYTFYRMLAQLGVDSTAPPSRKIHLNYINFSNNVARANYQTNFLSWTNDPVGFFTLVADKLLTNVFPNVSLTDKTRPIIVYSATNAGYRYQSDIHRCLQLAANIYDATLTNTYPTVFRPQFMTNADDIYIDGYVEETGTNFLTNPWISLPSTGVQPTNITNITNANIYGVPLVIGAKKGFPSFNEFTVETVVEVTRKLQVYKNTNVVPVRYFTNQMIILGLTNVVGAEAWNSYMSAYPRPGVGPGTGPFQLFMTNNYSAGMTNELGTNILSRGPANILQVPPTTYTNWPANAFFVSVTNQPILTNSIYTNAWPYWVPLTPAQYSRPPSGFPTPTWNLNLTNRLVYGVIDNGRIVDFVNLDNLTVAMDVSQLLIGNGPAPNEPAVVAAMWDTNRLNGSTNLTVATIGVNNQINVSLGQPRLPPNIWTYYSPSSGPTSTDTEINKFRVFMGLTPFQPLSPSDAQSVASTTNMAAPFAPTRKVYNIQRWAADDPLVHYTLGDLAHPVPGLNPENLVVVPPTLSYQQFTKANYRKPIDQRQYTPYSPWGGKRAPGFEPVSSATNALDYDLSLKDPLVRWSDDWDFPTNKFGSIGWLGRVHRGTPWQTVYFKALMADPATWVTNRGSLAMHPTNDWLLADLFTIAPNDDTARGLLSINQTNLAAWSAVFSGTLVLSNTTDYAFNPPSTLATFADLPINPSTYQLTNLYDAINRFRDNLTDTPRYTFTNVSQLLAVPELTVGYLPGTTNGQPDVFSPYLRSGVIRDVDPSDEMKYGLNDVAYERIPQQILSLVTLEDSPRIVVYAFGQSLKPAERSVVLAPGLTYKLCTNYQITGEVVTRTVLRIENAPQQPRAVVESYNVLTSE